MTEIRHQLPHQDGYGGFRIYVEDEKGGFRNENGTHWSPPIRSIPKIWQELPVFKAFGETILATAEQLDWRAQTRHRNVDRVTAYYPGFTPVDRAAQKDFRLYVDLDDSQITGRTITWFDYFGKYTFTADHDKPDAAIHMLEHAIERLLVVGAKIDQALNAQFTDTLPPTLDPAC